MVELRNDILLLVYLFLFSGFPILNTMYRLSVYVHCIALVSPVYVVIIRLLGRSRDEWATRRYVLAIFLTRHHSTIIRTRQWSIRAMNFTFTCPSYPGYSYRTGYQAADLLDVPRRPAKFQLVSHICATFGYF